METLNKKNKGKRPIDEVAKETYSWWKGAFTTIKKTKVRTWKGVFIIAFIAGSVAMLIWNVSLNIQTISEAEGETATLSLDPVTQSVIKGEVFDLDIILDTNNNDTVAVRAIVNYDTSNFSLESWNTDNSAFSSGNTCVYNGKPCEIVSNDTANGIIDITQSKPSQGVNTSSGVIATLTFKALKTVANDEIKIDFTAGSYEDSDVILDRTGDDGEGTDILASVVNSVVTVGAETCASFAYSDWGECQPGGTQTRTVLTSSPEGCVGGNPDTAQTCTYTLPTCESFTYNNWGECQPDSTRSRTVASSSPEGCTGGNPELTGTCTYTGSTICTSFVYNDWATCQPNNTQSRTVASSLPENCSGGSPVLSRACIYTLPACSNITYTDWGECQPDGIRRRTVISHSPLNCDCGNSVVSEECEYAGEEEEEIAEEIEVSKPKIRVGSEKRVSLSKSKKIRSKSKKFSFKGNAEGLVGGAVQIWIDGKLKKEVGIKDDGSWKVKVKAKKNKTYSFRFKYIDKNGNEVDKSGKYYVKVDSKDPKFTDLPLFLNKRPGDKIWWKATDNDKVKYYKYYFNGKKKETKKASMIVPASTPRGIYTLQVRAYDKAGNKARRYVVIRVR